MALESEFTALLARAEGLLARLERLVPEQPAEPALGEAHAFRWRRTEHRAILQAVAHAHGIRLADLLGIVHQKEQLDRNTRQFLAGLPANDALLWGARGTGKSSLVKALLNEYAPQGLRLIEVDKHDLLDLPDIVERIEGRTERFLVFCDDLSFEADDPRYKAMKVVLDGSVSSRPDNLLIYATSNRRHLLPEFMQDNLASRHIEGELHPSEAVEEKIALSDRFGLWLSFYPFNQDDYLTIVEYWLSRLGTAPMDEAVREEALRWALARGSRSGRSAWQFARDWAGRTALTRSGR